MISQISYHQILESHCPAHRIQQDIAVIKLLIRLHVPIKNFQQQFADSRVLNVSMTLLWNMQKMDLS